jgi:hypothetical protein
MKAFKFEWGQAPGVISTIRARPLDQSKKGGAYAGQQSPRFRSWPRHHIRTQPSTYTPYIVHTFDPITFLLNLQYVHT